MKEKKINSLDSYIYNVTYANPYKSTGRMNFGKFLSEIKEFDFKDGDYVTLADMTYGPNIHLVIEAGIDDFSENENSTIIPETGEKHSYIEVVVFEDNQGTTDKILKRIWLEEEYPNGLDEMQGRNLYNTMYHLAREFIVEEINKLPLIWVYVFEGKDDNGVISYHVNFNNFEDAKAFFDEKVASEKDPEHSWVGEVYESYENEELDEDEYEVEEDDTTFSVSQVNEDEYYVVHYIKCEPIF